MLIDKWDGIKYTPTVIKDGTYLAICDDMDAITTCPNCGAEVPFGESYTSNTYFFKGGVFGMSVCSKCHRKEYRYYYD